METKYTVRQAVVLTVVMNLGAANGTQRISLRGSASVNLNDMDENGMEAILRSATKDLGMGLAVCGVPYCVSLGDYGAETQSNDDGAE